MKPRMQKDDPCLLDQVNLIMYCKLYEVSGCQQKKIYFKSSIVLYHICTYYTLYDKHNTSKIHSNK